VKYQKSQIQTDLYIFLSIIGILLIVGSLFIYSASSIYALETSGSSHYFVKRQVIGIILGLILLCCAAIVPLKTIKKLSPILFFSSLLLTAATLLPQFARHIHGSSRWMSLGGLTFQPSEMLKISLLLYLGYFLDKKSNKDQSFMKSFLPLIVILGTPSLILLKQPDFGFTVTLITTAIMLLFIAQFQIKRLLIGSLLLIPGAIALVVMYPYRLQRVLTFLNPWQDPQGKGFQIIQSLIAIGSGGVWGTGIAHSKQKFFYLPMQHTDFIFSIIAEETGFVGAVSLIVLYALFLYFGLRIGCQLSSRFSMFSTLGFVILISLQAVINIMVATGLAPTKGLGLPFISYGNTALVMNLCMLGIIINMVRQERLHTEKL
jgi:cell division protein FtsW